MLHLIMCEFGSERKNAGWADLPAQRLDPTLSSTFEYFPNLRLTIYTDCVKEFDTGPIPTEVKIVTPSFDKEHPRYGWRCTNYYRAVGLLESTAEVAVYMDSDMKVVSDRVRALIPLTERFGICLPANPRLLVGVDGTVGADTDYVIGEDDSLGTGFACNMTPIAFATKDPRGRALLECFRDTYRRRGPLSMWRAIWKSGIHPYLLPFQWCVCKSYVGLDDPIILHWGHWEVADYYSEKPKSWNPFRKKRRRRR